MTLPAYSLLALLAVAVFASGGQSLRSWAWLLVSLVGSVLLIQPGLLSLPMIPWVAVLPAQFAVLLVLAVALCLRRTRHEAIMMGLAALMVTITANLLQTQGLSSWLALLTPAVVAATSLAFSLGRTGFRTVEEQEKALLVLLIGGLILMVVPEALTGWQTGENLQTLEASVAESDTLSMLMILVLPALLGMMFMLWKKWKEE